MLVERTMNRKDRKAQGIKGKKGDSEVIKQAILLARQLQAKKQPEEAAKLYKQILEFDPDNTIALLDLGIEAYSAKKNDKAEEFFEKVLRLDHKDIGAIIMLAALRMDQNRPGESLDLMQKAERIGVPQRLMTRMGILYRDAGQLQMATQYIDAALKEDPEDISALYTLQTLRKMTADNLDTLRKIGQKPDISLDSKIRVEFTAGKGCLDNKMTEQGFWHFAEANLLKRATYKYSIEWIEDYFEGIPKLFNEAFRDKFRNTMKGNGADQIFIVGMPRSGSTLVDQIISSHPKVTSVGEAKFMGLAVPVFPDAKFNNYSKTQGPAITKTFIDKCNPDMLRNIGDRYLAMVEPYAKEQKIVVDKMLFNFIWVGLIRLVFPEAKIIHCVRDPIDIGLSIWQLLFSDDIPWAYDQNEIGRYYLAYSKLMGHWHKLFPGEILDVHYEEMVEDQEGQSRRVIEFCGLPWHDDCLKFYENKRKVKTASVTQVRQPMYKDSVKKWKKYEKQLQRLITTVDGTFVAPKKTAEAASGESTQETSS